MQGFKGFDKDMKCRGFKYEIGKTFVHDGEPKLCHEGFHFCEHPLDVFGYYPPSESVFAEVEGDGKVDKKDGDTDSKVACTKLTAKAAISINGLIQAAVKFVFEKADWSKKESQATGNQGAASATGYQGAASATGNQGAASATGDQGAASATGYQGAASATGYQGAASATGEEAVSSSLGIEGKAMGKKGCWLVLSEWKEKDYSWHRINVKSVRVDGKKIKEDVWYTLKGGKFVVVK